jgi:preprotein translocase subunit YajC
MNFILLQATSNSGLMNIVMMVAVVAVVYLFMIRPQTKRQKEEKKFRESLSKGDKIVTIGGVHGKILSLDDKTVLLEVDEGVKLRYERAAIRSLAENETSAK